MTTLFSAVCPVAAEPYAVPRMQALPLPREEVSFERDGVELARYHFGSDFNRPFVFPLIGPAGRSITRFGHLTDPQGHRHHYSVWVSHKDVDGVSFWEDEVPPRGRIVHQSTEKISDSPDEASVQTVNAWMDADGHVLLRERRRTCARDLTGGEWLLIVDIELSPAGSAITLGRTPFGLFCVRMAATISVRPGGGLIRSSEGGMNEKEIYGKSAKWVDYSGPITASAIEGATLFDHPANPNHPSVFHVRDDGWMCASLTFKGPRVIASESPLRLRYGVYVHAGLTPPARLHAQWTEFAGIPVEPLAAKSQ